MKRVKSHSKEFVETLHKEGAHYGAVSHFDSSYSVGRLRGNVDEITSDIDALSTGGKTALYDSIISSMYTIHKAQVEQDRVGVPALLLTFTDGKENKSDADLSDVRTAIKELGFAPQNRRYFAIAGIGRASQQQLKDICKNGLGLYTHTDDDVEEAFKLFVAATLAVVKGRESYAAIRENEQEKSLKALVHEFEGVVVGPLEYMLNIDTSGSMSKSP